MTKSTGISRRTVLRGLGTVVALPWLEAALPRVALAAAGLPLRFCFPDAAGPAADDVFLPVLPVRLAAFPVFEVLFEDSEDGSNSMAITHSNSCSREPAAFSRRAGQTNPEILRNANRPEDTKIC